MKCINTSLIVVLSVLLSAGAAYAQLPAGLPEAAKPAAQIQQDVFLYPELEPEPGKYVVPPVVDRPLSTTGGPRIKIEAIELRGAVDRPEKGLKVDDVWKVIEEERAAQPDGLTIGELQEMANKITDLYREHGFIVAHAFVPVQTVEDGIVTIQVLEGVLGRVLVEGDKRYTPEQIASPFDSMLGQPLFNEYVESALVRLTDYPGLTAFGVFQPGQVIGDSDLVLKVQDEKGGDMTYSLDNHGSAVTGQYISRVNLGVNNMFGKADRLDMVIQRSIDPALSDFMSFKYSQMLFKPQYRIEFGQDESDFAIDGGSIGITGITGKSRIIHIGLRNDFERGRIRNAHWLVSIDRKTAKTFQDERRLARDHLAVLKLEYGFDVLNAESQSLDNLLVQFSHGENSWLGSMDAYDDQSSSRRTGSGEFVGSRFDKLTLNYTHLRTLSPTRSLLFRLAYQYTSNPLLGMEQFTLGGPNSVRAFPGSEFTMDRGVFVSAEHIWNAPGFADKASPFGSRKWGEILTVSAFAEWAYGEKIDPLTTEDATASLKGWGLGAQLAVPGSFTTKLTAAWPMMDTEPASNKRRPQVFFNFEADLF